MADRAKWRSQLNGGQGRKTVKHVGHVVSSLVNGLPTLPEIGSSCHDDPSNFVLFQSLLI